MSGNMTPLLLIGLSKTLSRRQRGAGKSEMQSGGTRPLGATDEPLQPLDRVCILYVWGRGFHDAEAFWTWGALRDLGVASISSGNPLPAHESEGVDDTYHTYTHTHTCKGRLSSDVGIHRDQ